MALGPGKYDAELADALGRIRQRVPTIHGGILIVVGAPDRQHEGGFAAQLSGKALTQLPHFLRGVADQIEADLKRGKL
jgi:hypothetical protein